MATPGSRWKVDKETIVTTLKQMKGRLSHASKALNVSRNTLLKRIREYPEIEELLEDLRNDFSESMLDEAEGVLVSAMDKKDEDMGSALKASFYALNNKGEKRGYSVKNNPHAQAQGITLDDLKHIATIIEDSEGVSEPVTPG